MNERRAAAFVGRDESLGLLRTAVRRAAEGFPRVLLVSGETGVGKTRLVRELVESEAPTLLYGACVPMAGDPLPFAPLIQALRRLERAGTLNLQLERSPELARLVPGLVPSAVQSSAAIGSSTQLGLFQAVLDLLDRLGAAGPVLHIVEDVHWADRSTLDLVRYLATNLVAERVVLLVTYRADAVLPGNPLADWLAELARLDIIERVALERLGHDDTVRLIEDLLGEHPDPELVESTLARSAGNPLFAEHLVLHGRAAAGPPPMTPAVTLPVTLHDLLRSRVSALPDVARSLLRACAVVARPAPLALLADTLDQSIQDTEAQLRPAIDQHVLEVRPDDTIGFRHPAFAEVVYGELLPGERSRLHRSAAEALESWSARADGADGATRAGGAPDALAGELARHWLGSGDASRALDAAVTAAGAAERMYAFADAHALFARAADLMRVVPGAPHDRVRLLKHAAQAASLIGDGDEAQRLLEAALATTTEPSARAALWARLGAIHYLAGHGPQAERCFREALSLVPEDQESVLVARIYAGLALLGAAWSRLEDADDACAKGLRIARTIGARKEEGLLRNAMGVVAAARGDVDAGIEHLRAALEIARQVGNPNNLATAYINLSHVLGLAGRADEVVELCRDGGVVLTRVGLARQAGTLLKANATHSLIDSGRITEAASLINEALAHRPRGIISGQVLTQAGRVALVRGDLSQAWQLLEQARLVIESQNGPGAWLREVTAAAAEVELWAGRPAAAYDMSLDGLELVEGSDEESFGALLVALGLRALADQAETRRDTAGRRRLAALSAPLHSAGERLGRNQPDDAAIAAWQRAETSRLDQAKDPSPWAEAARLWEDLARPFPAAYARWREAEARLDRGVDATAIAALRRAHTAALGLGAARLTDELERLAGWHHIDVTAKPAPSPPAAIDAYGLTPRELEVLSALADGRTNREIAVELFISAKTASVHVSNILRKLDVSGRQQAARVAHRLGIGT